VRIERLGDDATAWRRNASESAQKAPRPCAGAEHPEVLPEHDHRVEEAKRVIDGIDREGTSVTDTAALAASDCSWRGVDADDLKTAVLKMQADAAPATAHVEDSALD